MNKSDAWNLAKQNLEQLHKSLMEGKPEELTRYLRAAKYFNDYSLRNTMMIVSQRPEATRVAGFHAWKRLGRSVLRGESGIAIFAPVTYRKDETDAADDPVKGFRVAHVFDILQTEGDNMPELPKLKGDTGDLNDRIERLIAEHEIELIEDSTLPANVIGRSYGGKIGIRPDLDLPTRFHTLVHELAHELLHRADDFDRSDKIRLETEAEAVAFTVSHACGLECLKHVCSYIGMLDGGAGDLQASLDRIHKTSSYLIEMLKD